MLDFESLYPNCMIDMNFSNETCVDLAKLDEETREKIKDKLNVIEISENKKYYFLKREV